MDIFTEVLLQETLLHYDYYLYFMPLLVCSYALHVLVCTTHQVFLLLLNKNQNEVIFTV